MELKPAPARRERLFRVLASILLCGVLLIHLRPVVAQTVTHKPTSEVKAILDEAQRAMLQGKAEEAGRLYDSAAARAREMKDGKGEADALRARGNLFLSQRQLAAALERYEQSLAAARSIKDRVGEGAALHNIGLVHSESSRIQQALEHYLPALALHRETGNKLGEMASLFGIGVCYGNIGEPEKSLDYLQQALTLYRQAGNRGQEALALANMGAVFYMTGRLQKALESYHQALVIQRETGDKRSEAEALNNIGVVYLDTGQAQQAIEYHERSLPLYREINNRNGEAQALGRIGLAYLNLGDAARAREYQERALPIFREVMSRRGEAATLTNLGSICQQTAEPRKAVEYYRQSLPLFREVGDRRGEGIALTAMGTSYYDLRELDQALATFQQSLEISRLVRNADGEALALSHMGDVYAARKQPELAAARYDDAIEVSEQYRANLGGFGEAKSGYLQTQLSIYHASLRTHLQLKHAERAFARAQQTKGRSLLDLMASGRVDLSRDLSAEELAEVRKLGQEADLLNQKMVREGVENEVGAKKRFAELQEQLRQTERRLQTVKESLYARHPRLAAKTVASTATLATVGKVLPADTALLDFVVLSDRELVLFVVTAGKVGPILNTHLVQLNDRELSDLTTRFRDACSDPRKEYREIAREIHSLLLTPAEAQLKSVKRLLICPDGSLWDVPFQVLIPEKKSKRFLAERFEVAYAYSATGALAALQRNPGRRAEHDSVLALANPDFGSSKRFGDLDDLAGQRPIDRPSRPIDRPSRPIDRPSRPIDRPSRPIDRPSRPIDRPSRPIDRPSRAFDLAARDGQIALLPGTQREADTLRKGFPGSAILTGAEAQESIAKREAGKYRFLHFATHGFFNDSSPLLSSIVLAQPAPGSTDDGFLTAREIFDLDLSAEMAVLSACNSGRGVQRKGDGVIGLTWALFVAGCPTQVVSQWSVDDASTAKLMEKFYGNLSRTKQRKGAALRQASLALMRDQRHPYFWAPFILVGDWR